MAEEQAPSPAPLFGAGSCGLDEVGRGALAGPLVAAAVVLPDGFSHPLLRDSKLLSEAQRESIEPLIRREAVALGVSSVGADLIDQRGLSWANRVVFERLIAMVGAREYLVDGNLVLASARHWRSIVGGDRLVPAISAASIVAKVYRDRLMRDLHPEFPDYGWDRNKGYGTEHHLRAISRVGVCPHPRLSFIHPEPRGLFEELIRAPG